VARALHDLSGRTGGFLPVNCGGLAPSLLEAELFGYERGSFTGATRTHRGFFERADRGTLFLDEVAELPADAQVKLLRVLEDGVITRVGGESERRVEVRVVAATHMDLGEAVERGRLREDLFYRISVLHVEVPPLRDRPEDVASLAETFLEEIGWNEGRTKRFSAPALRVLEGYGWPGNARELKNIVYSAYLSSDREEIGVEAIPPELGQTRRVTERDGSGVRIPVGISFREAERSLILATLEARGGSKPRAAEVLGICVKTLYNRLHSYGWTASSPEGVSGLPGQGYLTVGGTPNLA
jgi:DNA-binding NtrC family response regulator